MNPKKNTDDQFELPFKQAELLLLGSKRGDDGFDLTKDIVFPLKVVMVLVFLQGRPPVEVVYLHVIQSEQPKPFKHGFVSLDVGFKQFDAIEGDVVQTNQVVSGH